MKRMNLKQIGYWTSVIVIGIFVGVSLQFVKAWTEPGTTPPGGNLGAPINTGSSPQIKNGVLQINSALVLGNTATTPKRPTPAPNKKAAGNIYASDVWINGADGGVGKWASQMGTSTYDISVSCTTSWSCAAMAGLSRELIAASSPCGSKKCPVQASSIAKTNAEKACATKNASLVGYTMGSFMSSCGDKWNGETWRGSGFSWVEFSCNQYMPVIESIYCKAKPIPSGLFN